MDAKRDLRVEYKRNRKAVHPALARKHPDTQGTLENWGTDAAPWSDHASEITSLDVQGWVHVPSAHGMFYECSSLRQVNFGRFDISAATIMSPMF